MSDADDDRLVEALWAAWREHRVLDLPEGAWAGMTTDRAAALAAALYRRLDATPSGAWKMGAFDPAGQAHLGLTRPLVAPIPSGGLIVGSADLRLSLDTFVQPRLEAEVGVAIEGAELRFVPCVEIVDCRFPGWRIPPASGLADFGLQGAMVFGSPLAPVDDVYVTVRHDGQVAGSGHLRWDEAVGRLALLPARDSSGWRYVATGAITAQFDARPGWWEFEFFGLATLSLTLL